MRFQLPRISTNKKVFLRQKSQIRTLRTQDVKIIISSELNLNFIQDKAAGFPYFPRRRLFRGEEHEQVSRINDRRRSRKTLWRK